MNRSYPLVEIHYALWAVLTVPIGFAGLFFLVPGLNFQVGVPLEIIAAVLLVYVAKLTQGVRAAWLFGLLIHLALVAAGAYYVPRWPVWLAGPLLAANIYSLVVLLGYRKLWIGSAELEVQRA